MSHVEGSKKAKKRVEIAWLFSTIFSLRPNCQLDFSCFIIDCPTMTRWNYYRLLKSPEKSDHEANVAVGCVTWLQCWFLFFFHSLTVPYSINNFHFPPRAPVAQRRPRESRLDVKKILLMEKMKLVIKNYRDIFHISHYRDDERWCGGSANPFNSRSRWEWNHIKHPVS